MFTSFNELWPVWLKNLHFTAEAIKVQKNQNLKTQFLPILKCMRKIN